MNARAVEVDSDSLRMIAKVNGRVRCPVFLFNSADLETPIAVEDLNLAASVDRERFLSRLSEAHRSEAAPLLDRLASRAAAASLAVEAAPVSAEAPELEPWDTVVDRVQLLNDMGVLVLRYVCVSAEEVVALTLWLLHTYLVGHADYTPYILVTSPVRECGKTTLLELLSHVAFRARKTDGITAAALYRVIDRSTPTMLLDELDTRLKSDGGEALRGVLNSGFQRGGKVTICAGDEHEVRDYGTFCPKVLAGIGRVWDTVTSRSIPIRLARASKDQLAGLSKIRGHRIAEECLPYRRKLLRVADDIRVTLDVSDPVTPPELGARQSDVWRPLLAIADSVGGHWPETARAAALQLYGVPEEEGDYGLLLLQDLRDIFDASGVQALASAHLIEELNRREDRPWPEFKNGKAITPRGLASLIGRFGVRPRTMRVSGVLAKGYDLGQLRPVFTTYLPSSQPALEESVTSVTTAAEA